MTPDQLNFVVAYLQSSRDRVARAQCQAFTLRDTTGTRAAYALGSHPHGASDLPMPQRVEAAQLVAEWIENVGMRR